MPMYGVLRSAAGVPLRGKPSRLGFWAKGNSCWGRLIIELTDVKGEWWLSILSGPEQPWMLDAANEHFISFDGWRWVEFGLPGNVPLGLMVLPDHHFWGALEGDTNIDYPLTLSRLIVELRDQVVHVNELVPVPENRVCFSDLMVTE